MSWNLAQPTKRGKPVGPRNSVAQTAKSAVSPTASRRRPNATRSPVLQTDTGSSRTLAGWQPAKQQAGQPALLRQQTHTSQFLLIAHVEFSIRVGGVAPGSAADLRSRNLAKLLRIRGHEHE